MCLRRTIRSLLSKLIITLYARIPYLAFANSVSSSIKAVFYYN